MVGVAGVRQQPAQRQPRQLRDLRDERHRRRDIRSDAAPVKAHVNLHQHVDAAPGAGHRLGPRPRDRRVIDDERQRSLLEQGDDAIGVDGVDRVGQPDVGEAGVGEHFGFAKLGAADADSAAIDLPPRDDRALVGLRVRPHPDAALVGGVLHAVDVGKSPPAIDDHRRRGEIVQGHPTIMSHGSYGCSVTPRASHEDTKGTKKAHDLAIS